MARRKVKPDPAGVVDIETRTLMTIVDGEPLKGLGGALVRYRASADLSSAEVERRVQQIRDAGAVAVKVEHSSRDGAAAAHALTTTPAIANRFAMGSWREELDRLFAESLVSPDELRRVTASALERAGL
jgi:hypothetical protein